MSLFYVLTGWELDLAVTLIEMCFLEFSSIIYIYKSLCGWVGGLLFCVLRSWFFCIRGRKEWLDPEASGYKSCCSILQLWLFHGFMPAYFLSDRSLGQVPCMMLSCFFSLNDESLLQHGKCSPGRKFNLQKSMQSAGNLSQHFPLNVSVPQHQGQSQYLLEHIPRSLILHLGYLQHKQECSYWDKWKIRQLLRILLPALSGNQAKFTVHTFFFYKCILTINVFLFLQSIDSFADLTSWLLHYKSVSPPLQFLYFNIHLRSLTPRSWESDSWPFP